jgi:CRISPR-associated protein Csm4
MTIYRLTIRPLTSFRTPLQSDTIFGHLMWALRYLEGEEALTDFLDRYRGGAPPLLVSAGFPGDTLPVPVLSEDKADDEGEEGQIGTERSLADEVVEHALRKALEDERYLPLAQWRKLASELSPDKLHELRLEAREELRRVRKGATEHAVTRTAVDRITGSAREGRLFVSHEVFYAPHRTFDIWHKVMSDENGLAERLTRWWRWVERNGFGSGKSSGHGTFRFQDEDGLVEAGSELPQVEEPNGFVTLSAWVPKAGDPTDVTYRTRIKRGKLGEALAVPSPWKKPLLMLEPGAMACLHRGDAVTDWYGRLVENVHWAGETVPEMQRTAVENVVQLGYAFPLPVRVQEVNL